MGRAANLIKTGFQAAGLDLSRAIPSPASRRTSLVREHRIASVIDVGANRGQYASEVREAGFTGALLSFEPQSAVYPIVAEAARADGRWTALQLGLSDAAGTLAINIAGNTASSSLLPMATLHEQALPESAIVATEDITLARLDEVPEALALTGPLLLKIDVQGAELSVLAGAAGLLDRVELIEMELCVRELYEGQPLLPDCVNTLAELGFSLFELEPCFRDTRTGAALAYDGLFTRSE